MRLLALILASLPLTGQVISAIAHSESATSSILQWTTDGNYGTSAACGTTMGGPYPTTGVDDGVQTSVRQHYDIVAGLVPSTTYYCKVTSGSTTSAEFSFTTPALPKSYALSSLSLTAGPTRYNLAWPTHYMNGDTLNNAVCADGKIYLGIDDTQNFDAPVTGTHFTNACSNAASGSSNQSISTLTGSPLVGTLVNQMSGFLNCNTTDTDSATAKEDTVFCVKDFWNSDVLFMHTTRQGGSPGFARTNGGLLKSSDHGVTWTNWLGASNTNGAPPSPITSNMLGGTNNPSGKFSSWLAVMYQPAAGISPRVDNQDAYIYFSVPSSGSVYLMRVPRSKVANLSGGDYQWFTGGDGNLSSNWSTSSASAAVIYTSSCVDTAPIQHISTLNRYMLFASCYVSQPTSSKWVVLEGAHPWSTTWTQIYTTNWTTQGYVDMRPLASTVSDSQLRANGNSIQIIFDGDYTSDPFGTDITTATMYYQLWYGTFQILPTQSSAIHGQSVVRNKTVLR